jgi:S1-C subfamily serine protease
MLDGGAVEVLGPGRVSEKAIAQLHTVNPWIEVGRLKEESLGIILDSENEMPLAKIDQVLPGSPAERGGVQKGDRILELNGKPVRDFHDVQSSLGSLRRGQKAPLKLLRDGKKMNMTVEIGGWD